MTPLLNRGNTNPRFIRAVLCLFLICIAMQTLVPDHAVAMPVPPSVGWSRLTHLGNGYDGSATSIAPLSDGFVVAGHQWDTSYESRIDDWAVIMTLDFELNIQGSYIFDAAPRKHNKAFDVIAMADGFVIAGYENEFFEEDRHEYEDPWVWILKMNLAMDTILWENQIGNPFSDWGNSLALDLGKPRSAGDEGFVIGGWNGISVAGGQGSGYLIRTDDTGNFEWEMKVDLLDESTWWLNPEIYSILKTADDGLILGTSDGIIKLDMVIPEPPELPIPKYVYAWKAGAASYFSVIETDDPGVSETGFIAVGSTRVDGEPAHDDLILTKFTDSGFQSWTENFGRAEAALGATGLNDVGLDVIQTNDGGFAVVGYTQSYGWHGGTDLWFIKTDNEGDMEWDLSLGSDGPDRGNELSQSLLGYYTIAGKAHWDGINQMWILRLLDNLQPPVPGFTPFSGSVFYVETPIEFNATGSTDPDGSIINYEWEFGDGQTDTGMVTSHIYSRPDTYQVTLYVTDNHGIRREVTHTITTVELRHQWDKDVGTLGSFGLDVTESNDGGFVVSGMRLTGSGGDDWDMWVSKIDGRGNPVWDRTYRDTSMSGVRREIGWSVIRAEGGYIVAGDRETTLWVDSHYEYQMDFWVLKLAEDTGDIVWSKHFMGEGEVGVGEDLSNWDDRALDIVQVPGSDPAEYVIAGYTSTKDFTAEPYPWVDSHVWLVKIDEDGNELWNKTLTDDSGQRSRGKAVAPTDDGGFIVTGEYINAYYEPDRPILIMKADADGNKVWQSTSNPGSSSLTGGEWVTQAMNGGYVIAGMHSREMCLTKVPEDGFGSTWHQKWTPSDYSLVGGADKTPGGGYIISGQVETQVEEGEDDYRSDLYVMATDSQGEVTWEWTLPLINTSEGSEAVISLENGGFAVLAHTGLRAEMRTWLMKIGPNAPPTAADFTISPPGATVGQSVSFEVTDAVDPDGTVVSFIWDFGDGISLATDSWTAEHVYFVSGTYTVTLAAVDNGGAEYTTSQEVIVTGSATAVTIGSNTAGSIELPSNVDVYSFWGWRDNQVHVDLTRTSGEVDLEAGLYTDEGQLLIEASGTDSIQLEYMLPEYANYYVIVRDHGQDDTGTYELAIYYEDQCPADPAKTVPGDCGCGVPDIHSDGDGLADCIDDCPLDSNNDADSDGVCGNVDNCPWAANPGQENLDGDSLGNACDSDADGDGFDSTLSGGDDSNDLDAAMTPTTEQGPAGDDPAYDGNGDGTADHTQPHVTSLSTFDGGGYVTLASSAGTIMSEVTATGNPSPADSPAGVDFSYGFFSFTISGVGLGGSTTVTLYLPSGAAPDVYYKHGPLPSVPASDWYRFMLTDDGVTGAQISGNVITLHFTDMLRGDDITTVADSKVIDIGGPGLESSQPPHSGGTGSTGGGGDGGGGCFISSLF